MIDNQGQQAASLAEVEAIRHGLKAYDAGGVRPFAEFATEMRAKFDLPTHLSDEEITRSLEPSAARRGL